MKLFNKLQEVEKWSRKYRFTSLQVAAWFANIPEEKEQWYTYMKMNLNNGTFTYIRIANAEHEYKTSYNGKNR